MNQGYEPTPLCFMVHDIIIYYGHWTQFAWASGSKILQMFLTGPRRMQMAKKTPLSFCRSSFLFFKFLCVLCSGHFGESFVQLLRRRSAPQLLTVSSLRVFGKKEELGLHSADEGGGRVSRVRTRCQTAIKESVGDRKGGGSGWKHLLVVNPID